MDQTQPFDVVRGILEEFKMPYPKPEKK